MGAIKNGIVFTWRHRPHLAWHQSVRLVAALVLVDQALGPITHIPSSEGIVIVALGVLFAPIPAEKAKREK